MSNEDVDDIFAIFSDPDVIQHYDVELFRSKAEAEHLIHYFQTRFEKHQAIRWAIREQGQPKLIGSCGFTSWNEYDFSAIIGYDLHPNFWGKGYAKEAVQKIIEWAFSEQFPFKVNRIESVIMPSNKPSIALCEKLGFQFEGTLREKVYCDSQFHDMNLYSLLRRDFLSSQKTME
ncbi:MAG: GNAT family N-acetyltransferase [Aestuariibacter sp.]